MRARVYVDGLNLYYGALKGTPYKWLDLARLCAHLLPATCVIEKIRYFTAHVSGISDPGAPARQHIYLNALRMLPEIDIFFGSFLTKTVWRPLVNLPVANRQIHANTPVTLPEGNYAVDGRPNQTLSVGSYPARNTGKRKRRKIPAPLPDSLIAEFHTAEEKGSDVNLAAHLLDDAWRGLFEVAAVISNDTDLVTPIRMVAADQGKTVYVVCPGKWQVAPKLKNAATGVRHMRVAMLKASQFPDTIPQTGIYKPAGW